MDRRKRLLTDGSGGISYREFVATNVMEPLRMDGESTVRNCDLKAVVADCLLKFWPSSRDWDSSPPCFENKGGGRLVYLYSPSIRFDTEE